MKISKVLISLISLSLFSLIQAESISYTATKDNTLYQSANGDLSNGAGIHLFTGRTAQQSNYLRRALIYFPVHENIPAGASIDSVFLSLVVNKNVGGSNMVSLHRLIGDWGEELSFAGTTRDGDGAPAETNDATWLHQFFDSDFWDTPGGDYDTTTSAAIMITSSTGSFTWGSTPEMVDDVQKWLDNPSNNYGWIIIGNETESKTAIRFASRENSGVGIQPSLTVYYSDPSSIKSKVINPVSFELEQNFPNPFNPETIIRYTLAENSYVTLKIFDVLGREVQTLVNSYQKSGPYQVSFNGSDLPNGVYFYRINAGSFEKVRKMMLVK